MNLVTFASLSKGDEFKYRGDIAFTDHVFVKTCEALNEFTRGFAVNITEDYVTQFVGKTMVEPIYKTQVIQKQEDEE